MIRAIANKRLDLSKEEYHYYLELEKNFGKEVFKGLFESDERGIIISITPSPAEPIAMVLIFFLLNVMMNQRLRGLEELNELRDKVASLEKRVEKMEKK